MRSALIVTEPLEISYTMVGVIFVNPCELTAAITALANAIACKLNVNELNLLSVVLTQLGDTLATIATQRSIMEESREQSNEEE